MFNFMETLFMFSLGITFLLLLLLIYHFKQRLSAVEQKHDVLLEILNTVVQETHTIKAVLQTMYRPPSAPATVDLVEEEEVDLDDDVEDLSDEENEEEEEEDSDDDDDDIEVKELDEVVEMSLEEKPAALDTAVLDPAVLEPVVLEPVVLDPAVSDPAVSDPAVSNTEAVSDNASTDKASSDTAGSEEEIKANVSEAEDTGDLDEVQRMKLPALRELAVQRGLVADASKMKKPELLELLK